MDDIEVFGRMLDSLGDDAFCRRFEVPILLKRPAAAVAGQEPAEAPAPSYQTRVTQVDPAMLDALAEAELGPGFKVVELRKSATNPFHNEISIGRSPPCDIVLKFGSVSKMHGQFVRSADGWTFIDAGSTNGTFINGEKLEPARATPIKVGDRLKLGAVDFEVIDGQGLLRAVKESRQPAKKS